MCALPISGGDGVSVQHAPGVLFDVLGWVDVVAGGVVRGEPAGAMGSSAGGGAGGEVIPRVFPDWEGPVGQPFSRLRGEGVLLASHWRAHVRQPCALRRAGGGERWAVARDPGRGTPPPASGGG